MNLKKMTSLNIETIIIFSLLIFIAILSIYIRTPTYNPEMVLDYDPWWYYRYTETILENDLRPPQWDLKSFFPPGRYVLPYHGWSYIMIVMYYLANVFSNISLMVIANIAPLILMFATVFVAYLLGRELFNKWAGLAVAIFSTLSPAVIGVSFAGYCDTDVAVVFFSFLTIYSFFLALKKRNYLFTGFAIAVNLLFIFTWAGAWIFSIFFSLFIPALILFRILEDLVQKKKLKIDFYKNEKLMELIKIIFIILVISNGLGILLGFDNMVSFFLRGFQFIGAQQIVNLSVAELQPINIFSRSGFTQVASRVGTVPLVFTMLLLPLLVIFKISQKAEITPVEIFLFMWAFITFYLILHGVRFALLFSSATAFSAGYVIGNMVDFFKDKEKILKASAFGFVSILLLMFISDAVLFAQQGKAMSVSKNWVNALDWLEKNAHEKSLVATWWDPGHIIAGYTGLKVHADGAHCSPRGCVPYPHNTRIQNMGRVMSTDNEQEAIEILEKYTKLTPEQCQQVKQRFGDIVPEEACEPISEMYFISSSDLIGKFTWMNYFGGYRAPIKTQQDIASNPGICCAPTPKTEPGYASCNGNRGTFVWCPWAFTLSNVQQDNEGNNIYIYKYGNMEMALVQKEGRLIPVYNNNFVVNYMSFFANGVRQDQDLSDIGFGSLQKLDGLIWLDTTSGTLFYFPPAIRDSMFVRTFFYGGEGLEHFELVYQNGEIRLFKIHF